MTSAHMILQGKGGVGKSLVASMIVQYLTAHARPVTAIDTDPVNHTLAGYKAFNATQLDIMDGTNINTARFDAMIERMVGADSDFVIDNGASAFVPLSAYLIEADIFGLLAENGVNVVVHTVVTGGQSLRDTVGGFVSLCAYLPASVKMVVWLNEHEGPVAMKDMTFEKMAAYRDHKEKVIGIVTLADRTRDTFGADLRRMLENRMTFEECLDSDRFGLVAKSRLARIRNDTFGQMALIPAFLE